MTDTDDECVRSNMAASTLYSNTEDEMCHVLDAWLHGDHFRLSSPIRLFVYLLVYLSICPFVLFVTFTYLQADSFSTSTKHMSRPYKTTDMMAHSLGTNADIGIDFARFFGEHTISDSDTLKREHNSRPERGTRNTTSILPRSRVLIIFVPLPPVTDQSPGRATRGIHLCSAQGRGNSRAFGPTYGKGLDQEDDDGHDLGQDKDKGKEKEDPAAGSSRSKGKKRKSEQSGPNNKKKVRSDDDQDQDAPICEACGGKWHTWKKCYYVFPSKAPAWFKSAPIVKDGVTHRLSSQEWKDRLAAFKAGPSKPD
ncbi:hypothetical protein AUP68_14013 [Ilyonectria robusta]